MNLLSRKVRASKLGAVALSLVFVSNVLAGDTDADGDGISDQQDNCTLTTNSFQQDSDGDGIGNACDPDIAPSGGGDCVINFLDQFALASAIFSTPSSANWNPDADLDGNGVVNFIDLSIMANAFFGSPGPSGIGNACTDKDNDGFTSDSDCNDGDPLSFPGASEICDGEDNDCDLGIDEDIPTDGAACSDPGAPVFDEVIDTLHIVALTGSNSDDGTNSNQLSVCLTATDCWSLNNANFNDFERSTYDVFSFENVGIARALIDRVEIRSLNGPDAWIPECVQINFDGEPVYCENPGVAIGTDPGDTQVWSDPAGLHLACQACNATPLTHGPMVGAVTDTSAKLWARTDSTRRVELRVANRCSAGQRCRPVGHTLSVG